MGETTVKYLGATRKDNPSDGIVIDGLEFPKGVLVQVNDDDLVQELREGSDRLKGYKFEVGSSEPDQPDQGR